MEFIWQVGLIVLTISLINPACAATTTPPPVNCSPSNVTDATYLPSQATFVPSEVLTYACDVGYGLSSGNLVLTCLANGTWDGALPTCSIKTCAAVDTANATRSPDQAQYNYNDDVTYSCDTGFSYASGDLVRTCVDSNVWNGTLPVCIITCVSSDVTNGAKSPTTATIDFNTIVTYTCDVGYNMTSGDADRLCQITGDLDGTLPVCTIVTCTEPENVTLATKAPIQSSYDYGTSVTYTCDLGYTLSDTGNLVRTCNADRTWSGDSPVCTIVTCAVSPPVADSTYSPNVDPFNYSMIITYTCDTGYELTSGSLSRTCQSNGFFSGTTPVCSIRQCAKIAVTGATLSPDQPLYNYNTAVTYTCNPVYNHTSGDLVRTCDTTSNWTDTLPVCTLAACVPLSVANGQYSPVETKTYIGNTITYTCNLGHYMATGNETRTCQADGTWSNMLPTCPLVQCVAPAAVPFSTWTPNNSLYNYNTAISYTCNLAYNHTSGDLTRTCLQDFSWLGTAPVCTIAACIQEDSTYMTTTPNQILHQINGSIVYQCILGYNHSSGDLSRTCQSNGVWTGTTPACVIVTCPVLNVPAHSTINPNVAEVNYNTAITYTCDLGYNRTDGDATRRCTEFATFEGLEANCTLVTCDPPAAINDGTYTPMLPEYDYNMTVTFSCNFGYYLLSGVLLQRCDENANWVNPKPVCEIMNCSRPTEAYTSLSPDLSIYTFNMSVNSPCILGYNLTFGDTYRTCQHTGLWDGTPPNCEIITCDVPAAPIYSTILPTAVEVNYNTFITYLCDLGYNRTDGDATRRCTEFETFEGTEANCTLVTCDPPAAINDGTYTPMLPEYDYNMTVTFSCNFGYYLLSGVLLQRCDENANWVNPKPVCEIMNCSRPTEAYTSLSPDLSIYTFNMSVNSPCILGYNLTFGDTYRTCQHTGLWDGTPPNCEIITCDVPAAPIYSTILPTAVEVNYNTFITYLCDLGYNRTDGDATRRCTEFETFEGTEANCTLVTCDPPAAINDGTYTPMLPEYDYNMTVTFSCNFGYYLLSGVLLQRCDENANWVNPKPVCEIMNCSRPTEAYTSLSPDLSIYTFNMSVNSPCILGYNLTFGDTYRTCQHTGLWDGTPPNCEIITCDVPAAPIYSTILPTAVEVNYNTFITYLCDLGYNRTDGDATRRCTEFETFEGTEANCTLVTCDPPAAINDGTYTPMLPEYDYNMTVTFSCNFGYYLLSGNPVQRCDENANWVNAKPICEIMKCPRPTEAYTSLSPDLSIYNFNTSVTSTCVIGYNLTDGDATRTCQHTGQWDGTPPNCTIVECEAPPPVLLSTVVPISSIYVYMDTLIYTCDIGYEITSGNGSRTCTETTEWTGTAPNCTIKHCPIPPDGVNNTYVPVLADYVYNDTIVHSCDLGYNYSSGDLWRICQDDKTWSGVTPVCIIVTCPRPTEAYATVTPDTPTYDFNTTVTSTCILGYNLTDGDATRTCQHTGLWDGIPPNCTIVECEAPPPVLLSTVVPISSIYLYMDTLIYTCDIGYEITSGNGSRTCTETTEWTGTAPNCTIKHCPIPPDGVNNTYVPVLADYVYNDTIVHSCDLGYNYSSGDLWRICQDDKTWSGVTPVCIIVTCPRPTEAYATVTPDTPTYDFNTTVTSTCILGYNLTDGDATSTCQHTGLWDGIPPNCTIVECEAPPTVIHSTVVPISSIYVYLDTLTYTRDIGFEMTGGDAVRTCTETGEWTGTAPNFTIKHCPIPPDGVNNTYVPVLADYVYNDTIVHSCDLGYNYSSGDLWRICQDDKTWSGVTPVCIIVTCPRPTEDFATVAPDTTTYDFNTSVTSTCILGYNLTDGDATRTCQHTGLWGGTPPNCTLVECEAPPTVIHSTVVPISSIYVYLDTLTYTRDIGFEMTGGDAVRTCTETGEWTGTAPNFTIKHCLIPPDGVRNTYVPVLLDYVYNDTIDHTCDIGYNHSSGDLWRRCQDDKKWSGVTPVCVVITCDKIDVPHMTFNPPTNDTHDFNVTIEYACDLGYNHTYGDLIRTCNYTTEWTGTLPNCTLIDCDPPDPINHTSYVPYLDQHDWNTSISYSCDVEYHYVSGAMETTCNESGVFPPTYTDCSVKHYLTLAAGEPEVTWYNITTNSTDTIFDYDGLCDVIITCVPPLSGITQSTFGTQLTMTVTQTPSTVLNEYLCTLYPHEGIRTFPDVTRDVFFGMEILDFQAYLDYPSTYLAVGDPYLFVANATDGSNVTLEWNMEANITIEQAYPGAFSTGSLLYTFNKSKRNITVLARNKISNDTSNVFVDVIYRINGFNLSLADTLGNTTHPITFDLHLMPSANIPMDETNISMTYSYGANDTATRFIDELYGVDINHYYYHLFDIPGNYLVETTVNNPLGFAVYSRTMRIWDTLLPLELDLVNVIKEKYLITNTDAHFEFINVPNYGYKYSIDYGDGFSEANASDSLMYEFYNLSTFVHNYTSPGVYIVHWTAVNGEPKYNRDVKFPVHVQNVVPATGYTLRPSSAKYPWTIVQIMDIELNITLNATVDIPTNATCIFDPDDGNSTTYGLTFDNSFFQFYHAYRTEGLFNATFNCSNDVSNHVYQYDIEIRKFRASDLNIIYNDYVPLNKSSSVIVSFYMDTGFIFIPKYVNLTWDYGDGTNVTEVVFDSLIYTHQYTERGNVTINLFVEAQVSSTTNTLNKPLRLGIMYFKSNMIIQFINVTIGHYEMYGIIGDVNYTLDSTYETVDDICPTNENVTSCSLYKFCTLYGYHTVNVIGSNGSFTEFDSVDITCDNPIELVPDIPTSILIPNGTVNAMLRIPANGLPLPMVNCTWNMGDPVKRNTYGPFSQWASVTSPVLFIFQYIALGRHTMTINCWNLINSTRIERYIVVTNDNFVFTGVFDRIYSQEDSPMYISSMRDTEIFGRLLVEAPVNQKTHTNLWGMNISAGETNATRQGLLFTRGLVPEYTYKIKLSVCFIEEPDNCIFEPTYAKFVMPPPHAEIVGGARRFVDRGIITVDAFSLSYDPVFPDLNDIDFSWQCERYDAADFEEATDYLSISNRQSCSYSEPSPGIMSLDTDQTKDYFAITVTVDNKRGKTAMFTQIAFVDTSIEYLTITCKINCLSKVAVSSKLQLVPELPNNCQASFDWTLKKYSGMTYVDVDILDYTTEAGANIRPLTLEGHTLEYGTRYLVTLTVTLNGVTYGPAFYEFLTNTPPKGGHCRIIPINETTYFPIGADLLNTTFSTEEYNITAGHHTFNLTCLGWMDEGFTIDSYSLQEPLLYVFFLTYGDGYNETYRQIVYFDPGQTSNLVSFQPGDVNNDYKAQVILRITDVIGDYADVIYNIRSVPTLTNTDLVGLSTDDILVVLSNYMEQFNDELIKANRTCDYRTLSRKVIGIATVYNELQLNTSAGVVLTPDDLLSLGFVRNDADELLSWVDYWKIIVEASDTKTADYLAENADSYAEMIYASVATWPPNKRMTLVAIETIARALNASTAMLEFSNVTAAVASAKCADAMARSLANIVDDRTFPHTEQLELAASGVWRLIRNILAILQTELTPNFPQNPTVEEMRNYLTYVSVFKTTEEVLNAPLSIQEQTFLSQKQLQKYHLQKYIKSQASREALPHVTHALRNLTHVYERLSELGHEEFFLENDYVYMSVELSPAHDLFGGTINRPRVALELNGLAEDVPETCSASTVSIKTILFKHNPYFWGQFADRITSYVPLFDIDGATLNTDTVTYRLENNVEAECVDKVPTYDAHDPKKMIYVLFDRQHAEDDILIFVRPNTSELIYKLYFNKDIRPNVEEKLYSYSTDMVKDGQMWTPGDGYKLIVKSSEYSETGKIWLGLKPILESSGDLSLLTKRFCANVTSVSCLALRQDSLSADYVWDKDLCEVSLSSTRTETICTCQNSDDIITVGTTSYIPFNMIDFKSLEESVVYVMERSSVIATMVVCACVYVLLVIWAWREDVKDQYKWSYSLMIDNDIADLHFYIVRVFTGLRSGAGTQSKIGFVLVGEDCDSNIRTMDDDSHIGFERGSVRTLVMSTRKYLGNLMCLRIWHDDTGGNNSSWFLNKINVTDLKTGKSFSFVCNQWLDYDTGDNRVDRLLHAMPPEEVQSKQDIVSYTIAEHHLWISIFIRPFKSNFTRVQRLTSLLALIYLSMIICTLTIKSSDETKALNEIIIGPFRFSKVNFETAMVSMTISSIIIGIVTFFFMNSDSKVQGPDLSSLPLKAYQKANDHLKLDKSVLGRRYWPPAENALEYDRFLLPHFFVYIGWAILVMSVVMATYMIEMFTPVWTEIKSDEWMTTICVAMFCSVVFIESAKVIIVLLAYYLFCHKGYEPPDPTIDAYTMEEIARYNSATLTIGPQYEGVLGKPDNPSDETLLANKSKRLQDHQVLKIISQLAVYGALLYMIYTISYESRDPRSFFLKDHVEKEFKFQTQVTDLESFTTWLKTTFIKTYFSRTYYGAEDDGITHRMYMEDLVNFRIGPARLRQLRIKPGDCLGPLGRGLTCHGKYVEKRRETTDYCLRWQKYPCFVSETSSSFSSPAWKYTSAAEVWGFPTIAQYCTFGGGGYFMKLDVNREVCEIIFNELIDFSWFDKQTRGVIIEFTLYNANTNLFVYTKFVGEFPEVGGFLPYLDIQVFRLYLNTGPNGNFILFLQFFFLLIVIAGTFLCGYEMSTDCRTYFKSVWNLLDLAALAMGYITISIFIYKNAIIKKTIEMFNNDKNAYIGFENLAFYDFVTNTAYGILVFLLSVRVSRILGYSGKINEMTAVIKTSASDLSGFLLIFGITYFAYVIWGTLLFGKEQEKYKDVFQTYGTLTEAVVGKNRVSYILSAKPGYAEFYYFTFVLFVLMTLATLAAAILNHSISEVKKQQKALAPSSIVDVAIDKIVKFWERLTASNKNKSDEAKKERRDSDSEINEILLDLRKFTHSFKSKWKKNKASDKYKLTED